MSIGINPLELVPAVCAGRHGLRKRMPSNAPFKQKQ